MKILTQKKLIKFHEIAVYVPLLSSVSALIQVIALKRFKDEGSLYGQFLKNQPTWKRIVEFIPIVGNIILIANRWIQNKKQKNPEAPDFPATVQVIKPKEVPTPSIPVQEVMPEALPDLLACKIHPRNPQEYANLSHEIWNEIVLNQRNPDQVFNVLVEEMQNDPDCLLTIVNAILEAQHRGRDLNEAHEKYATLRKDIVRKIDLEKVIQDPSKLKYNQIDSEFKIDPEFLLEAFEKNVLVFKYLPLELQNPLPTFTSTLQRMKVEDEELMNSVHECLRRNWQTFCLQRELMLLMCKSFPKFVHNVVPGFLNDPEFGLALAEIGDEQFQAFLLSKTKLLDHQIFLKNAILKCIDLNLKSIAILMNNINSECFNNLYNDVPFLLELIMKIRTLDQLKWFENWLNTAHNPDGWLRVLRGEIKNKLLERENQLKEA